MAAELDLTGGDVDCGDNVRTQAAAAAPRGFGLTRLLGMSWTAMLWV